MCQPIPKEKWGKVYEPNKILMALVRYLRECETVSTTMRASESARKDKEKMNDPALALDPIPLIRCSLCGVEVEPNLKQVSILAGTLGHGTLPRPMAHGRKLAWDMGSESTTRCRVQARASRSLLGS